MSRRSNSFIVPGRVEDTQARISAVLTMLERFEEHEAEETDSDSRARTVARYGIAYVLAGVREAVEHMASDHFQLEQRTVVKGKFSQPDSAS